MRSLPYRRQAALLTAVALLLAITALIPARAQPPAPDKTLPDEARSALDSFLLNRDQPQPQQIPFVIYQLYMPFVAQTQSSDNAPPPASADITVTLRPDPSIRVARSSDLVYTIRARNLGGAQAEELRVELPIDAGQIDLLNFSGESGDFVSVDAPDRTVVTFGPLAAGERRSASLLYAVNDSLPDDSVISVRANVAWDGPTGGMNVSNWAPVLVGDFDNALPYVFLSITPDSGPAGTAFTAFSDRFIPGEPLNAWLNTPGGIEPLDRELDADSFGRVSFSLDSSGLAPAGYELVVFGQRSKLTAVQAFTVSAP